MRYSVAEKIMLGAVFVWVLFCSWQAYSILRNPKKISRGE